MASFPVRRLTWLLLLAQSLSAAGLIAGFTVGTIAAADLSGQAALAGVPGSVYLLGTALGAYPASRLMERFGRRPGLSLGFVLGTAGALLAAAAILVRSFPGFVAAFGLMGGARGFTDLSRYAAAEMYVPAKRARAISLVVLGGTVGAIGGPSLVGPTGRVMESLGSDALAGPWFAAALLFGLGALLMFALLRPDPRDVGRQTARQAESELPAGPGGLPVDARARSLAVILSRPGTRVAVTGMVIGQLVMVMLMAITSLHMKDHGHSLENISLVIMAHTLGMFGLSVVTGRLADNFGRAPTLVAGAGLLLAASLLAPLSQHTGLLALALFLLGLGWNFCYVAGAALLTDTTPLAERARVQGGNDLLIGLVSAVGTLGSGIIFAGLGFAAMAWISLAITLVPLWMAWKLTRQASRVDQGTMEGVT